MAEASSHGLTVAESVGASCGCIGLSKSSQHLRLPHHGHARLRTEDGLQPALALLRGARGRIRKARARNAPAAYGLEVSPDAALDTFFDEILAAPGIEALVLGLYGHAVPALVRALERFIADTNKLFDHPTWRICRLTLVEMRDVLEYGEAAEYLIDEENRTSLRDWTSLLERLLSAAGELNGAQPEECDLSPIYSAEPYQYDHVPKRDERFQDPITWA